MGTLAPKPPAGTKHVQERLEFWSMRLLELNRGLTNMTHGRREITDSLDHWLDVKWALEHPEAVEAHA